MFDKTSVITFATQGKSRKFRDYTKEVNQLKKEAINLGAEFSSYSYSNYLELVSSGKCNLYPMRKGAGYWSWKPHIILEHLKSTQCRYVLYLDVDFSLIELPNIKEIPTFEHTGLALYETNEPLKSWCSSRLLKSFPYVVHGDKKMFTASVLLLDSHSQNSFHFLEDWAFLVNKPEYLLDPLFTFKENHRHDQSLLSILAAQNRNRFSILPGIFYQSGVDNDTQSVASAWAISRNLVGNQVKPTSVVSKFKSRIFHKIELVFFYIRMTIMSVK